MSAEVWLPIPGFEGRYDVSDQGRVRSWLAYHGRSLPYVLAPSWDRKGYPRVCLHLMRKLRTFRVHELVLLAFVGPLPAGMETRHLDGNKGNAALTNLHYGTQSENMLDRVRHGTHDQANKTHCPAGHPYDEANTCIRSGNRWRTCRACDRERNRRNRARLAAS